MLLYVHRPETVGIIRDQGQEPRSTCSVIHTAPKGYVTLRASLSGTLLQRMKEGCRKPVLGVWVYVCVCLSFSAFRLQCPPLSEFFTPFPLSQSISDLCLSDCLRPPPPPPPINSLLVNLCLPPPTPQSIQIQTMGPVRDTFKLTFVGCPTSKATWLPPDYHPATPNNSDTGYLVRGSQIPLWPAGCLEIERLI